MADAELLEADIDRLGEDGWVTVAGGERLPAARRSATIAYVRDRADGRYLPYYEDEYDLARMRSAARWVESVSPMADAVLRILKGYIVGPGFAFTAKARPSVNPEAAKPLVAAVQRFLDQLADRNRIKSLVSDSHDLGRLDGEYPVAVYPGRDGLPQFRPIDAGCVTEPKHAGRLDDWRGDVERRYLDCCWRFGVRSEIDPETGQNLTMHPLGYHVVYDDSGRRWDYIPRDRMELFRHNVPVTAKRGVSDFYKTLADLERELKLNRNSAEAMTILSAIPYIKEYATAQGLSQGTAPRGADTIATARSRQEGGTRTVQVTRHNPGTIPLVQGAKYIAGPLAQMNVGALRDVANAVVRRIGIPNGMPGWMLTGDTETALYSSVLAMGSPFVNACIEHQSFLKERWLALHWKALRCVSCRDWFGASLEEVERWVEIECTAPAVAIEPPDQKATRLTTEVNANIKSRQTACEESGGKWEVEKARIKAERAEGFGGQPPGASPFGGPATSFSGSSPQAAGGQCMDCAAKEAVREELLENCGTGAGLSESSSGGGVLSRERVETIAGLVFDGEVYP